MIVDSALTCFVICGLAFFLAAYLSPSKGRRLLFYVLCYVSCTLAFYAKGFIGVAIPGLAVLAFLIFDRNIKEILKMHLWLGIAIFLAMTLPWFLSLWRQGGGEYLKVFLVHNHLERFAGGSTGHSQPFYYYLAQFPGAFLPWSLLRRTRLLPELPHTSSRSRTGRKRASSSRNAGLLPAFCS